MATAIGNTQCFTCEKEKNTYNCKGCSKDFCFVHLTKHRQTLGEEFDKIENDRDLFLQILIQQKENLNQCLSTNEIDKWEEYSINKIKQTAAKSRQLFIDYTNKYLIQLDNKLMKLTEQLRNARQEDEFNEKHLNEFKQQLTKLKEELNKPPNISIHQDSTSFINKISVTVPFNMKWKQDGITVAGGNKKGNSLNQLSYPRSMFIDNQTIYIGDYLNNRVFKWETNATDGQIIAVGNAKGRRSNKLNGSRDIIIDKKNDSLIASDRGNRQVVRLSCQNNTDAQIIIEDIDCWGLTMDKNGYLYVSDCEKNEVIRWKIGDKDGIIVAGGNGRGNNLNQLNIPTYIFVDQDYSVYVSDRNNDRVMKWMKGAKEGIVVAGGNGEGNGLTQMNSPGGLTVDQFGQIYVTDYGNHRVMCWIEGATEGTFVVGGNGRGKESNQFQHPQDLSFDEDGNLYIVDQWNHRIQKFETYSD